mgnify:CR=1 FL=1
MSQERRHFARISFDMPARLITTETAQTVRVLDLSLKGALLQLPAEHGLHAGQPCLLDLPLQPHAGRITMAAELAHVQADRAGLLCRSIDLESITHLRRLVEVNLGDAQLAERELKALVIPG